MGHDGINFFSFSFVSIISIHRYIICDIAAPHALVSGIRRFGRASIVLQAERFGHLRGISGINERNVERVRSENHIILHNTWMYSTSCHTSSPKPDIGNPKLRANYKSLRSKLEA
jgi:hypothetical protein